MANNDSMGFLSNVFSGGKETKKTALVSEANKYISELRSSRTIPTIASGLMLDAGEEAFLEEPTKLHETRAVRTSKGNFGGLRIAKGVTIGGYSGRSESNQEWRAIDQGVITLTNKRIFFDGDKGNRSIPVKELIKVDIALDSIQLSEDGKTKDIIFSVSNPYIWGALLNIIKRVENPLDLKNVDLDIEIR